MRRLKVFLFFFTYLATLAFSWHSKAQDLSIPTEKMLQILTYEQLKTVESYLHTTDPEKSLSVEKESQIKEALRLQIRAMIKTKSFSNSMFEHMIQNYPDFIAFQIVYSALKFAVVNPILASLGQYQLLALMAFLPENYPIYGGLRVFKNWYNDRKMKSEYKFSTNERDRYLSQLLQSEDYKKIQLHLLEHENNLMVLPIQKNKTSDADEIVTLSDLEKIIHDPQFTKDLRLLSPDKTIYQNILLNTVLSSENGQDELWNFISKKKTLSTDQALMLTELLKLQKTIRLMSVKFSSVNILTWFRAKPRARFFKQQKVTQKLVEKIETLERMKWKIAQDIKNGTLNSGRIAAFREQIQRTENDTNEYLAQNSMYSKMSFCPAVFAF